MRGSVARTVSYEVLMRSAISVSGTLPKGMRSQLAWKQGAFRVRFISII